MRDQFSARRIESPGERLLAMHPFVDVLQGRRQLYASLRDGPARAGVFSDQPIDEQEAILFAHAFHARGGGEQRSAPQLARGTPPPGVFRADRALTGPINPYLTAAARSRTNRRPFAA